MQIQSNSTQDKTEHHTSGKVKKNKKKKISIILGIIVVIILLLLFLPPLGRITRVPHVTPEKAKEMRCRALAGWYERVRPYISENNQKPLSLIEICQAEYRKDECYFPYTGLSNDYFPGKEWAWDWDSVVNDPNRFKKEVPYDMFRGSNGWFIKELVPGRLYKKMLMIDQDGKIYELREIPKRDN